MAELLTESAPIAEALKPKDGPGRFLMTVITPGWGSSGYYSAEVLKEAAENKVWPKGTQQHIDHQTAEERAKKPEGSINTLAGVLMEDAYWDDALQRVVAEAKVFSAHRQHIAEAAEFIGVSIVASADRTVGEAEGRQGPIVERLYASPANRVDFVTHAGRGGRVEVLEAAVPAPVQEARNVGQWLEAQLHSSFTNIGDYMYGDGRLTREERITLSGALGEALAAFTARVDADAPQLFTRDLYEDPAAQAAAMEALTSAVQNPALSADAARAVVAESAAPAAAPTSVEANPGQTATTPAGGNNMAEVMIESTRLEQLEEASGRVPTLVTENDALKQRVAESERRTAVAESAVRAQSFARQLVRDANSELPEAIVSRVVAESTREIPLTDDLRLDTDALTATVNSVRESEEAYIATLAQESGLGAVRGVGSAADEDTQPTITQESAAEAILALTRNRK